MIVLLKDVILKRIKKIMIKENLYIMIRKILQEKEKLFFVRYNHSTIKNKNFIGKYYK